MTTHNPRLLAAEADFTQPSQVPTFSIEKEPFSRFFVSSQIELPIIAPFTKEAKNYFTSPSIREIKGIEQDPESGNYIITASSSFSEDDLYRSLRFFVY